MLIQKILICKRNKIYGFKKCAKFSISICFFLHSFVSTLLTAILTHHLGWVGTVAPLSNCNPILSTHRAVVIDCEEKAKMSEISKFHPYNALWAQLGDLYGSIGNPSKISKTIVCGNHQLAISKVLNILTYFVRCGEIRREQKTEIIDKDVIDTILVDWEESKNEFLAMECDQLLTDAPMSKDASAAATHAMEDKRCFSLTRASTCMKDLNSLTATENSASSSSSSSSSNLAACCSGSDNVSNNLTTSNVGGSAMPLNNNNILVTFKRNDIPNVFIFRDSRFVQQELRIGNTLMDCGIERIPSGIQTNRKFQLKTAASVGDGIKLFVTNPDNEEINLYQSTNDMDATGGEELTLDDTVEEAKEDMRLNSLALLWGIEPIQRLKKGLKLLSNTDEQNVDIKYAEIFDTISTSTINNTVEQAAAIATSVDSIELKRSKSLYTKSNNPRNISHIKKQLPITTTTTSGCNNELTKKSTSSSSISGNFDCIDDNFSSIMLKSCPSLSDLITANSVGISERLTWGIERVKEAVSYEEEKHFEFAKQMIEKNRDNQYQSSDVVFVLGENEALIGLKHSVDCPNAAMKCDHKQQQHQRSNDVKFANEKSFCRTNDRHHSPKKILPKQQQQIQLINLPMPKYIAKDNNKCNNLKYMGSSEQDISGFVPSLFIGVTDHYIADFVLQVNVLQIYFLNVFINVCFFNLNA